MKIRKRIALVTSFCFLLSSCLTTGTQMPSLDIGPLMSSSLFKWKVEEEEGVTKPKLDVAIPVFDPGLPEDTSTYEDNNIWPEVRRAEANRFAHKLKIALDETEAFGAVRVVPDKRATSDLYVMGEINASDGEEIDIDIKVYDISGKLWFDKSFDHDVDDDFYKNIRNSGKDPYDPVFEEAAQRLVEELDYNAAADLKKLQSLTTLRFAANFSEEAFAEHLNIKNGKVTLASYPSDEDPMLKRVNAIRVRDQLFVDRMQPHYEQFSQKMETGYLAWQKASADELSAKRDAQLEAAGEAAAGVALIGLAVLAAVAGAQSDNPNGASMGAGAAVVGGMAGVAMLEKASKSHEEAKFHNDALKELGQSLEAEVAPQVVEFEEKTAELTGNAEEQFTQWRSFLKQIYAEEATPNVQL